MLIELFQYMCLMLIVLSPNTLLLNVSHHFFFNLLKSLFISSYAFRNILISCFVFTLGLIGFIIYFSFSGGNGILKRHIIVCFFSSYAHNIWNCGDVFAFSLEFREYPMMNKF